MGDYITSAKVHFLLLAVFMVLGIFEANAQHIKRLGAAAAYGTIIPHSSELGPISQTNPFGLSASLQVMNPSQESWEMCNCFHYLGLKFSYDNFNNPEVLGSAYSLTGTFEPILWRNGSWTFSLLSGIGFSYLSRHFDPVSNPENIFFSVPVNFLVFLAPGLEYRFASDWSGQVSVSYNHISNGGQKQPNKGMNYPMIGVGVNHFISPRQLPYYNNPGFSASWKYYADLGYSNKQGVENSGRRPVFVLAAGAFRRFSTVNGLGGGLELTQDYSRAVDANRWDNLIIAPFVAHHFLFGRIEFGQRMAYYLQKPPDYHSAGFYQRYTLKYRIWRSFWMGMGLKAHGHVAENIDFRAGLRF